MPRRPIAAPSKSKPPAKSSTKEWPQVDPLRVGEFSALSPYSFLQRAHYDWHPTAEQMAEARKLLRPLNEDTFVEQMKDTREPIVFTYVRRPALLRGLRLGAQDHHKAAAPGLTFVWTPLNGALLQSQTNGTETAWGTSVGDDVPVEGTGFDAEYSEDNTVVRYPLPGGGHKQVTFADDRIRVTVERDGEIVERIPVFDAGTVFSTAEYAMHPAPVRQWPSPPVPT